MHPAGKGTKNRTSSHSVKGTWEAHLWASAATPQLDPAETAHRPTQPLGLKGVEKGPIRRALGPALVKEAVEVAQL